MSVMDPTRIGSFRRRYGVQRAQIVAAAVAPGDVLSFGQPVKGETWVIHRYFFRGAAGMTVRLFVGSDPGDPGGADPTDEVDAVTSNPAVGASDEIAVEENQPVWALITGAAAGTILAGQVRYRRMLAEGTY